MSFVSSSPYYCTFSRGKITAGCVTCAAIITEAVNVFIKCGQCGHCGECGLSGDQDADGGGDAVRRLLATAASFHHYS